MTCGVLVVKEGLTVTAAVGLFWGGLVAVAVGELEMDVAAWFEFGVAVSGTLTTIGVGVSLGMGVGDGVDVSVAGSWHTSSKVKLGGAIASVTAPGPHDQPSTDPGSTW